MFNVLKKKYASLTFRISRPILLTVTTLTFNGQHARKTQGTFQIPLPYLAARHARHQSSLQELNAGLFLVACKPAHPSRNNDYCHKIRHAVGYKKLFGISAGWIFAMDVFSDVTVGLKPSGTFTQGSAS